MKEVVSLGSLKTVEEAFDLGLSLYQLILEYPLMINLIITGLLGKLAPSVCLTRWDIYQLRFTNLKIRITSTAVCFILTC